MTDDAWATLIRALGDHLRTLRTRAGLSQTTLASLAGISQGSVSRLEQGTHPDVPLQSVVGVLHALSPILPVVDGTLASSLAALVTVAHDLPDALAPAPAPDPGLVRLLDAYRALSPAHRALVVTMLLPLLSHLTTTSEGDTHAPPPPNGPPPTPPVQPPPASRLGTASPPLRPTPR